MRSRITTRDSITFFLLSLHFCHDAKTKQKNLVGHNTRSAPTTLRQCLGWARCSWWLCFRRLNIIVMNLQQYKEHFNTHLEARLDTKLDSVREYFPDEQTFDLLIYLRPYVDHGKRFRPYMVYLWYSMHGGQDMEYITRVGIISEMIHIFALIHDDICDQGTMRHGIPTYHKELWSRYWDEHVGLSQAMLIWDLVYTRAIQEACTHLGNTSAHQIVLDMLNEVVVGQMLDIDFSHRSEMRSAVDIANKDHLKSGQYTFQKPMMIGASLWWIQDLSAIESLWKKIWVAFQMRDDLLDWIPNKEWKTKMSDIQEWNQTVVMLTCHEHFSETDFTTLLWYRGQQLDESQISELKSLFEKYAIQEKVLTQIHSLLEEVRDEFNALENRSESAMFFENIIDMLKIV